MHIKMFQTKNLYIFILIVVFAYSTIKSYLKIQEEPTTFEETELKYSGRFPSLTFCLRLKSKRKDNYTTFQDLTKDVEDFKDYFAVAAYSINGKGLTKESYDLKNNI